MKRHIRFLLIISSLLIYGCATKPPTIAHTHIGHALTGWHDTPGKAGLFVVAENKAEETLGIITAANKDQYQLDRLQEQAREILMATDPQYEQADSMDSHAPYGTKQALQGAIDHITFAATSADASANLKQFAVEFSNNAAGVLERCDLMVALSKDIIDASSLDVANELFDIVSTMGESNISGVDNNANGSSRDTPEEYGLRQLRQDLQAMLDKEDPPYTTVDSWYLFNLIRLPSGLWIFKESSKGSHSHGY